MDLVYHHNLRLIQKLNQGRHTQVYLATDGTHTFIYKKAKQNLALENEKLALKFLKEKHPKESFFPRLVDETPTEALITHLPGEQTYPFDLSDAHTQALHEILKKINQAKSKRYSGRLITDLHEGTSLDYANAMWETYTRVKMDASSLNPALRSKLEASFAARSREAQESLKLGTFKFMHLDLVANIVVDGSRVSLIDWEYSGYSDPAYSIAALVTLGKCTKEQEKIILSEHEEGFFERYTLFRMTALANNYLWLLNKINNGKKPNSHWTLKELELALQDEIER